MLKQLTFTTNSVHTTWVKNVYSLGTQTGTNSVQLPTASSQSDTYPLTPTYKSPVIRSLVHQFITHLSPSKKRLLNPLNSQLYPQSTAPINNQNERKIGKE